ncbi:hypothetical protein WG947_01495 [Pontibacter sp. H259]|uniref:hypothetical protein n=1 Tax=Pontibacter sp. H259 TaxID=3133421 RepID=UPI0030C3B268
MYKNLTYPLLLLFATIIMACNTDKNEDKSIGSTHPKLEKQLDRDTANLAMRNEENAGLYQRYRITTEEYEKSGDYSTGEMFRGRLAPLKEDSHPNARGSIIALRQGMTKGVNFAGKYTVVTVECGTNCQEHFIVDRENGKIIDKLKGSAGAKYTLESRLFILNPADSTRNYTNCQNCTPQAYELVNGKLKKLDK